MTCRYYPNSNAHYLTHWGWVTHIYVSKLAIIGSDNGLSPDRHQAIIWTNAGLLLIGPLGTNFSEILIESLTFSFKKMYFKVSSVKRWPFCLDLNVLISAWWFITWQLYVSHCFNTLTFNLSYSVFIYWYLKMYKSICRPVKESYTVCENLMKL